MHLNSVRIQFAVKEDGFVLTNLRCLIGAVHKGVQFAQFANIKFARQFSSRSSQRQQFASSSVRKQFSFASSVQFGGVPETVRRNEPRQMLDTSLA